MTEAFIILACLCGSQALGSFLLAVMFRKDVVIWLLLLFVGTSLSAVTMILLKLAGVF